MHRAGDILPVATVLGGLALAPTLARAEPPPPAAFMSDEDEQEDRIDDGAIDEEDRGALRIGGQPGAADVHGQSWLSVEGFGRQLWSGNNDVGAGLVLALALDRVAQGPVHKVSDPSPAIPETPAESTKVTFPSSLARDCV